jgi:DNA-binding response OmpR family regulator
MLLQSSGHDVRVAHDGLTAVDATGPVGPTVLLLDIGTSRLNGHGICRRMRAEGWGSARC